jgi:isopentenyldiphosphate isomerase
MYIKFVKLLYKRAEYFIQQRVPGSHWSPTSGTRGTLYEKNGQEVIMEIWDLYDENGNLLDKKVKRGENLNPGEYHLVVHIWLYNDNDQFLIQKRNKPLGEFHGIWACTGGSAISGENNIKAAIRETHEEMGVRLQDSDLISIRRTIVEDYFQDVFIAKWNGSLAEVTIDPIEVQEAKWISKDELYSMIENNLFWDYGQDYFNAVIAHLII